MTEGPHDSVDAKKLHDHFIKHAIKRPGALHRALGVPEGQPIPHAKVVAAAKKPGRVGEEARFDLNVLSKH